MAKMNPNWSQMGVPNWSPNRQKWGPGHTLLQGWLPSCLQSPSGIDFGKVWELFWDMCFIFITYVWWFLYAFLSSVLQTKKFKIRRSHQKNAAESFQEATSFFVSSCIEKLTSERQWAFRSLLVICLVSTADICPVSAMDIRPASTCTSKDRKAHWRSPVSFSMQDGKKREAASWKLSAAFFSGLWSWAEFQL